MQICYPTQFILDLDLDLCVLQIVLSSVHAVKGLECVVCFVVGLDQKAWRFRSDPQVPSDVQQVIKLPHKL